MKASITLKRRIRRLLKDIYRSAEECDKVVSDTKLKDLCKRGSESREYLLNSVACIKFRAEDVLTELYGNAE